MSASTTFISSLSRFKNVFNHDCSNLAQIITDESPIVYVSMEFYDKESNGIKGSGGLGVLAADMRRIAEELCIPFVVVTPFYPKECYQNLEGFRSVERHCFVSPDNSYTKIASQTISTLADEYVPLDVYRKKLGSTSLIAISEPNFDELYASSNNSFHRLYQEVALGFAGHKALQQQKLEPSFLQLNEAPTTFLAIAILDDLCMKGLGLDDAIQTIRQKTLYTNHTLVQAAEGEFGFEHFDQIVMPNIKSPAIKNWLWSLFNGAGKIKLSLIATELSGKKSAVSKIHARSAEFYDHRGERVSFSAVTNGISSKWILPEINQYLKSLNILEESGLPSSNYQANLTSLAIEKLRQLHYMGRDVLRGTLQHRLNQYGKTVELPDGAFIIDFKRRFVKYKRAKLIFHNPELLANIIEEINGYILLSGKPHPDDEPMNRELTEILQIIDSNEVLKARIHYLQDYDEELGRVLSVGADCAINLPTVGFEACGTSFMKDMINFKILISTLDGGVADVDPSPCLIVDGDESTSLYQNIIKASEIFKNDQLYRQQIIRQLDSYLPIISGARMMGEYLKLFSDD